MKITVAEAIKRMQENWALERRALLRSCNGYRIPIVTWPV